jgi:hypothetical protein
MSDQQPVQIRELFSVQFLHPNPSREVILSILPRI